MKPIIFFFTCEHAGNEIPEAYQHLFEGHAAMLNSPRAYDFGAHQIADALSQSLQCDYVACKISRLLVDCNRSLTHQACFSEFTIPLTKEEKEQLINLYYYPFRTHAESFIKQYIAQGKQVLHISVHSFLPQINEHPRNAALALLYDSKRHGEKEVVRIWHSLLEHHAPHFRVRLNYPYPGDSDSFTKSLRKKYLEQDYLGIELECNQAGLDDEQMQFALLTQLTESLKTLQELL